MTRFVRGVLAVLSVLAGGTAFLAAGSGRAVAQVPDTTFRGIKLIGNYDPLHDKWGVVVLPVGGAFGDSVRTIVQRDLDYSDRFSVIPVDTSDPGAFRAGPAGGMNYPIFARLSASALVEIIPVPAGLHVALHDVTQGEVRNVKEFALPSNALSRDWRLAVHRVSDEIERWVVGKSGIAATRIAYIRGPSIRIVDSDGASEITVPTDEYGSSPAWNPNGSMLAYATYGPVSRILVIDLATGRSQALVGPTRNVNYSAPIFALDGTTVLFGRAGEDGADIYSKNVMGDDPARRLTIGRGATNSLPTASPDGRRIVYVGNAGGHPELYIMDVDGTNAGVLTDYDFSDKNYRSDPDWSPDGQLIAYQEQINGRFQIRTIRTTGSTPKQMTNEGENEQPSWAADGRHLVFTSTRTGVRQLWVLDIESNRLRQLTKSAGSRLAAWSPRLAAP